jgi:Tol biopolymer transport system component
LPPPVTAECLAGNIRVSAESLSSDGRFFAYAEDEDIFLYDRSERSKIQLSRLLSDVDPPTISGDGNRVLFGAGSAKDSHAFVWDRVTSGMLATFPVGDLVRGELSRDGRFVTLDTRDASFTDPPPFNQGGVVVVDLSTNERWQASVNDRGEPATEGGSSLDISDDGQRVVFRSVATNLVSGKPGHRWDVYLYDHASRKTVLAVTSTNGGYPDDYTMSARISGDGRTLVFASAASDIVPGDVPKTFDIFIRDVTTGATTSFPLGHPIEPIDYLVNLSTDGRFILFRGDSDDYVSSDQNGAPDGFVYDRALGQFDLVTRAGDGSPLAKGGFPLSLSGDGRVVAFRTYSPELTGDGGTYVTCLSVRGP